MSKEFEEIKVGVFNHTIRDSELMRVMLKQSKPITSFDMPKIKTDPDDIFRDILLADELLSRMVGIEDVIPLYALKCFNDTYNGDMANTVPDDQFLFKTHRNCGKSTPINHNIVLKWTDALQAVNNTFHDNGMPLPPRTSMIEPKAVTARSIKELARKSIKDKIKELSAKDNEKYKL